MLGRFDVNNAGSRPRTIRVSIVNLERGCGLLTPRKYQAGTAANFYSGSAWLPNSPFSGSYPGNGAMIFETRPQRI